MLDVAGNNLANVNTYGYKASCVTFAELLSQTTREAAQPTAQSGGTNPIQIGSGVAVGAVDRLTSQGSLTRTGQALDMAIEGGGYFVLNDGQTDVYTRVGAFGVDSSNYLVDPATGYRVQRLGYVGVADGFQDAATSTIQVPFGQTLPAKPTENISYAGNLSADSQDPTTNLLMSGTTYTVSGAPVATTTALDQLDQVANLAAGDQITITGTQRDGTSVSTAFTITNPATDTMGDLLSAITAAFPDSTADVINGEIRLLDDATGYSQTNLQLAYVDAVGSDGSFELPTYFRLLTPGSNGLTNVDVEIFDTQGISHVLSGSFVRTDDPNVWDFVTRTITGDISAIPDRRIEGLKFLSDGSYGGLVDTLEPLYLQVRYGNAPTATRTLTMDFGTLGDFDGVALSGGSSTVSAAGQDGYSSGQLSSLSVTAEGTLVGLFTNGVRKDLASMKLVTFRNPAGLTSIGNNYFVTSGNSGDPSPTTGLAGGAGAVRGGSLETSNVETATEFVNLIEAQNGFQANARTISVAHDMLKELSRLIQ